MIRRVAKVIETDWKHRIKTIYTDILDRGQNKFFVIWLPTHINRTIHSDKTLHSILINDIDIDIW